jgi:hypothetical protein
VVFSEDSRKKGERSCASINIVERFTGLHQGEAERGIEPGAAVLRQAHPASKIAA